MTSTTQTMDGSTRTLGYGYDATGQLSQLTHPDGQYLRYVNDRLGRTSEVWRDTTHKLVAWVTNKPGQLTQKRNGTTTDFAYLPDGRFASLTLNAAGTSQDNVLSATFNAAGQIASRSQSNDAFAFTGHQNVDRPYVANGLNQYLSAGPATFTYDANGNLTGDGASTWVYDVENRLVSARGLYAANLRYDPLGRLHETVTNVADGIPANDVTVRRLYDGGALVAEYDQTGTMLRRFVHGPNTGADTPLVWYEGPTMSQAAARMLNTDLQGSVTSVTDFNGAPLGINRYDEYGRPQSGNVGRFQYTGQAWLPEIGMYYYKARMYSPTLGRFMQTDPIGYADGVNWYNYVGGDPVNNTDPSGMEGDDGGIVVKGPKGPRDCFICRRISRIDMMRLQQLLDGSPADEILVIGIRPRKKFIGPVDDEHQAPQVGRPDYCSNTWYVLGSGASDVGEFVEDVGTLATVPTSGAAAPVAIVGGAMANLGTLGKLAGGDPYAFHDGISAVIPFAGKGVVPKALRNEMRDVIADGISRNLSEFLFPPDRCKP